MFFHIDPSDGLAIYEQVVRQVKFAVACGAVQEGELVPSVRDVARTLAVNPNTVARAYRQLQSDQVLEPLRGTGLLVARGAAVRCREDRLEMIRLRLRQVLDEARRSRLTAEEIRKLVDRELLAIESSEA